MKKNIRKMEAIKLQKEKLAENIISFVPFVFKRVMKSFPNSEISKHLFGLLHHIQMEEKKPMNYYSEKMMIPKSNLTIMADKLIKMGLVKRDFDPIDRRIITLEITTEGLKYLDEYKEMVKKHMIVKLEVLSMEDSIRMNELLDELRAIFNKLD